MSKSIVIYTSSSCGHCRALKHFLSSHDISYVNLELDTLPEPERVSRLEELNRLNPSSTVPTAIIGEKVLVGFREDVYKKLLNLP